MLDEYKNSLLYVFPKVCGALLAAFAGILPAAPLQAQREIVQPLPPPEMAELRQALARLAAEPKNVAALIDAGNAALVLEDIDAAIGFFGRAEALDSGNPRVKLGLAGAYVLARRPVEALRLFHEAERGGADASLFAAKRGLAFDLVGDNASAQQQYRLALSRRNDPRVREQLAISQAVSGDRKGFEATLLPLLEAKDLNAFRTRAFGLAILKREKEAVELAKAVMPPALAEGFLPYLRQLPQLSATEQAAAVHLGIFPAGGRQGGAAPQVAQASAPSAPTSSRLAPTGQPLGSAPPAPAADARNGVVQGGAGAATGQIAMAARPVVQATPAPPPAPQPAPAATRRLDLSTAFAGLAPSRTAAPAPGAVDVTRLSIPREARPEPKPAPAAAEKPKPAPAKPAAAAKPAKPAHPARHWVQLAAGSERDKLSFDWRRLVRRGGDTLKGKEPFVVEVGRKSRLLAGPYPTEKAANAAVDALREADIDSLRFDSADGQEVAKLK